MARLLLLSNGHGEDLSGAQIGKALKKIGHELDALPFVGLGHSYSQAGIKNLGNPREFSTGGLGYTSLLGRLTEIWQGQLFYLLGRIFRLLFVARNYDLLIVVGDVIPVLSAWLTGRPVVTYLVAYSSFYEGKLRLPWPCWHCLSSRRFLGIFSRDQFTADDLTHQLGRKIDFLGNPFIDQVLEKKNSLPRVTFRLGLLPGSRRPELDNNILLMLKLIESLFQESDAENYISVDMALVSSFDDDSLNKLVRKTFWELRDCSDDVSLKQLVNGPCIINIYRKAFVEILQSSDVLICMAGTAAEQAVGLAKPVIQLPGNGPQFTSSFAEAQRRLLGPTVFCAAGKPGSLTSLHNTVDLILKLSQRIKLDDDFKNECTQQATYRLGGVGAVEKMSKVITRFIVELNKRKL